MHTEGRSLWIAMRCAYWIIRMWFTLNHVAAKFLLIHTACSSSWHRTSYHAKSNKTSNRSSFSLYNGSVYKRPRFVVIVVVVFVFFFSLESLYPVYFVSVSLMNCVFLFFFFSLFSRWNTFWLLSWWHWLSLPLAPKLIHHVSIMLTLTEFWIQNVCSIATSNVWWIKENAHQTAKNWKNCCQTHWEPTVQNAHQNNKTALIVFFDSSLRTNQKNGNNWKINTIQKIFTSKNTVIQLLLVASPSKHFSTHTKIKKEIVNAPSQNTNTEEHRMLNY